MKTKKYLAALLALVMLLSILPMAAFAAEDGHIHDSNCECQSVRAVCDHTYKQTSGYSCTKYLATDSRYQFYHKAYNAYIFTCIDCGYKHIDTYGDEFRQSHSMTLLALKETYEESGETVYVYTAKCYPCGYVGDVEHSYEVPGVS